MHWSNEYIEYVVLDETVKLLNLRCLDLGYMPYNQPVSKVKFWGPPKIVNEQVSNQYLIRSITLDSTLDDLNIQTKAKVSP